MPNLAAAANPDLWPQGTTFRYLTVAGGALGDPTLSVSVSPSEEGGGQWDGDCHACGASNHDHPNNRFVYPTEDAMKEWAQEHAETCRAMPRPGNAP